MNFSKYIAQCTMGLQISVLKVQYFKDYQNYLPHLNYNTDTTGGDSMVIKKSECVIDRKV
jgi:hypothetical protein